MGSIISPYLRTNFEKIIDNNHSDQIQAFNTNSNLMDSVNSNITKWDSELKRETNHFEKNSNELTETVLLTNRITFKRKLNSEFNFEYLYSIKIKPQSIHEECIFENNVETNNDDIQAVLEISNRVEDNEIFKINQTKAWINKQKIKKAKNITRKYVINENNNRLRRSNRHKFRRPHVPVYEIQKIKGFREEIIGVPNLIGTRLQNENS